MIKRTQFSTNQFTASAAVFAVLLGVAAGGLRSQPGNGVRAIIATTLAPSPTGMGVRIEYGYGKTAAQVDSVWTAMLASHYFIGGLPIYSAYKVTGQDSARVAQGQFNTIARLDPQPASVLWPSQVAGAFAGAGVSGGHVSGATRQIIFSLNKASSPDYYDLSALVQGGGLQTVLAPGVIRRLRSIADSASATISTDTLSLVDNGVETSLSVFRDSTLYAEDSTHSVVVGSNDHLMIHLHMNAVDIQATGLIWRLEYDVQ